MTTYNICDSCDPFAVPCSRRNFFAYKNQFFRLVMRDNISKLISFHEMCISYATRSLGVHEPTFDNVRNRHMYELH